VEEEQQLESSTGAVVILPRGIKLRAGPDLSEEWRCTAQCGFAAILVQETWGPDGSLWLRVRDSDILVHQSRRTTPPGALTRWQVPPGWRRVPPSGLWMVATSSDGTPTTFQFWGPEFLERLHSTGPPRVVPEPLLMSRPGPLFMLSGTPGTEQKAPSTDAMGKYAPAWIAQVQFLLSGQGKVMG
jgi:hypothetical protein